MGHVIGKGRENLNTIETKTGVNFKVRDGKLYIKAESKKSEKLAVREIKALAVGIFGLKNSAKLRDIVTKTLGVIMMGKIVRGLHDTRTVRINGTFFPTWFTQFTAYSNRSTCQTRVSSWSYRTPLLT